MKPVGETDAAEDYRDFGDHQCADSPCFRDWALGVAADPEVLELLGSLPPGKRQPNLVFAAARWHGAEPGPYVDALRPVLLGHWEEVRATVQARATQTNEVGRCATLLPVLARLAGPDQRPLALLEVGASAGLCLFPDRYSYRWTGSVEGALDPPDGPSPVELHCRVAGPVPLPDAMPEVTWRAGIDLGPVDVGDADAVAWLRTLVWPEHEDRRRQLAAAVDLVRTDPPAMTRGDLVDELPALVETVPRDATLVVFHSAVLAYLPAQRRRAFTALVGGLIRERRGHWVSNEGPRVLPELAPVAGGAAGSPTVVPVVGPAPFVLAVDGRAAAWTHGHGRGMAWLEDRPA